MELADAKNDIKTLFFILNSLIGLLPAFVAVAVCFTLAITGGMLHAWRLTITSGICGIILLAVTALGYYGAIKDNKIMLFIYSGIMALAAVGDIVEFVLLILHPWFNLSPVVPLAHLGLTLLALGLAVILAILARRAASVNQGRVLSSPPT